MDRSPSTTNNDFILRYFEFSHLPDALKDVSKEFHDMAMRLMLMLPRNAERTAMLRKLLEAKDCAVRCRIADEL